MMFFSLTKAFSQPFSCTLQDYQYKKQKYMSHIQNRMMDKIVS